MEIRMRRASWIAVLSAVTALSLLCPGASAQRRPEVLTNPNVNLPDIADESIPLRDMPQLAPASHNAHPVLHPKTTQLQKQWEQMGRPTFGGAPQISGAAASSAQATPGAGLAGIDTTPGAPVAATIGLNFDGISDIAIQVPQLPNDCFQTTLTVVMPPDTNAAVGDTQVVEWVNLCYTVFDKATGNVIAGPFPGNQFWSAFGRGCETENEGDPIIQWDKLAHRWVAFQNVFTYPYKTCIAISTTADATGSYYRYVFDQPGFPDYPKVGIMPDAYYQTQNNFGPAALSFVGVTVCAYQRSLLLQGSSKAKQICFVDTSNNTLFDDSLLPADLDSASTPPPAGQPEVFLGSIDNNLTGGSAVYEYLMSVNWKKPSTSTFTGADGSTPITVPTYNIAICNYLGLGLTQACVNSPVPSDLMVLDSDGNNGNCNLPQSLNCWPLDTLGDRLMYRLAYFNNGGSQYWVVNHAVNDVAGAVIPLYGSSATAVRWYQFTSSEGSTALAVAQAGQTPDDGEYRWMGSAAMDKAGDIAIGYSRSSGNAGDNPSVYYTGQAAGEPAGTTDTEALIVAGTNSTHNPVGGVRWGDYSSMALDAADGCTFWYANEYLGDGDSPNGSDFSWQTRLASLKFPGCQ